MPEIVYWILGALLGGAVLLCILAMLFDESGRWSK